MPLSTDSLLLCVFARWYEVESESGLQLVNNSGVLEMADRASPRAQMTLDITRQLVKHDIK